MNTVIPRLIGIVDLQQCSGAGWMQIERALDAGLPAIMLRDASVAPNDDESLHDAGILLRAATQARGACMIVNRHIQLSTQLGADGVHLGSAGTSISDAKIANPNMLIGYSAHDDKQGLGAALLGADYIFLSPIFRTTSKPNAIPLGIIPLENLCSNCNKPVIALGGINAHHIESVRDAGAWGVAMIDGLWRRQNVGAAVRSYLAALAAKQ